MFDTVTAAIPLTEGQFNKLFKLVNSSDAWMWGKVNLYQLKQSSDPRDFISVSRVRSVADIQRGSWEKELIWSIPDRYEAGKTCLQVECSLPKLFYRGENVHLLYEPLTGLNLLKTILEKQFSLRLPQPETWHVLRADIAYAWKFPSELSARQTLDCLKKLGFPYKQPTIYNTAIYFPGKTYTVKLYLKQPEFQKHDKKALQKQAAKLENEIAYHNFHGWIGFLEGKAEGVMRFEVELHRKWFLNNKIKTFGQLLEPHFKLDLDEGLAIPEMGNLSEWTPIFLISLHYLLRENKEINFLKLLELAKDGERFTAPASFTQEASFRGKFASVCRSVTCHFQADCPEVTDEMVCYLREGMSEFLDDYQFPGGGYTVRKTDRLLGILQAMWIKFIGVQQVMTNSEIVEGLLRKKYRSTTAARLLGFWQYLQERGSDRAKEFYGKQAYNRSLRELKAAEVPKFGTSSVTVTPEILKFLMCIPSPMAVNQHTEHPDRYDNLFNHALPEMETSEV